MAKTPTRIEQDGHVVEIRPIDLEVEYQYGSSTVYVLIDGEMVKRTEQPPPSYRQRSLYEVYVDDVMRGYVYCPKGWGARWQALALRPQQSYHPGFHKHDAEEIARFGRASFYRHLSPGSLNDQEDWGEHERYWTDRTAILRAFPRMVELGRCPTLEEFDAKLAKDKIAYAERQRKDAEDKARWAAEREERKRQQELAAERAEAERVEELAGLTEIYETRDVLGLSNFQIAALERAISRVSAPAKR